MATQYPSKIDDNTSLPDAIDNVTPVKADVVNRLKQAILSIENELGTKPSGVVATVKARIAAIETSVNNLNVISLSGDLGGTLTSPKVTGLQGVPISSATPAANQALVFNGLTWVPANLAAGALAFTAGGDLSGTATLQTVIGLQGRALAGTAPTDGEAIVWDNLNSTWKPGSVGGGGAISAVELSLASGLFTTTSAIFTRTGGRQVDMSLYPATVSLLNRTVKFVADVDKTAGATSIEIQLYDSTNAVVVTGTNLTSLSNTNTEISVTLTVGSSAGNLRSDTPAQYELQFKMNGGGGGDAVFLTNARLVITYA